MADITANWPKEKKESWHDFLTENVLAHDLTLTNVWEIGYDQGANPRRNYVTSQDRAQNIVQWFKTYHVLREQGTLVGKVSYSSLDDLREKIRAEIEADRESMIGAL